MEVKEKYIQTDIHTYVHIYVSVRVNLHLLLLPGNLAYFVVVGAVEDVVVVYFVAVVVSVAAAARQEHHNPYYDVPSRRQEQQLVYNKSNNKGTAAVAKMDVIRFNGACPLSSYFFLSVLFTSLTLSLFTLIRIYIARAPAFDQFGINLRLRFELQCDVGLQLELE